MNECHVVLMGHLLVVSISSPTATFVTQQDERHARKAQLERHMIGLPEDKKQTLRSVLEQEEVVAQKESRKKTTTADFESLVVIGRGAFGEVRLVRTRKSANKSDVQIYALKSMKKEMMVIKNQVGHVKAERDVLATADDNNRWLTVLHHSFQDESHLYMVLTFMEGGDLMSLLMKEDTFSESVTRFFMAEAAHAISSVHALGYIHRDIKPDNMLLDARGHLKLTDLGLCKKVGEVSPKDHPEVIIEAMRAQGLNGDRSSADWNDTQISEGVSGGRHRRHGDPNAMSIDEGTSPEVGITTGSRSKPENYPTGKARREVSSMLFSSFGTVCLVLKSHRSFLLDGLFNGGNPRLHCTRGARRSEWCVWILLHLRCRLVVIGCDHV